MEIEIDHSQFGNGTFDSSNVLALPSTKIKKEKKPNLSETRKKVLSKKQKKKLEKIVERRGKKQNRAELLKELEHHQLPQNVYDSFTSLVKIQTDGLKKLFAEELKSSNNKSENYQKSKENIDLDIKLNDQNEESDEDDSSMDLNESEILSDTDDDEPLLDESEKIIDNTPKLFDAELENETLVPKKSVNKLKIPNVTRPHNVVTVNRTAEIDQVRSKLPIIPEEQVIMESINENLVTVLAGETGSGKTTQVPQFLYEAGYATGSKMIGITEPRRVAAIAMANRVAKELNLTPAEVSYQIRFEGNTSKNTKIKFMTDGVLLKEMENDFILTKYSVICIDEAHERSLFTDILIGLLSRIVFIRQKRSDPLRLVIMSATLRMEDFTANTILFPNSPGIIHVPTRQFPVHIHFTKKTPANYIEAAKKKVLQIHRRLPPGGILVFVTGQEEVKQLVNLIKKSNGASSVNLFNKRQRKKAKELVRVKVKEFDLDKIKLKNNESDEDDNLSDGEDDEDLLKEEDSESLHIVPLYSMLSVKDQQKVFAPPPPNTRLCVVATNVAETSLTIPSVRYVVDTGKVKLKLWDKLTGVHKFTVAWSSKASAEQRAGRAGRTGPGHCYRLFSSAVYNLDFKEYSDPEIRMRPVEDMVLLMKSMSINRVHNFPYPTHPGSTQLHTAEKLLLTLGALQIPKNLSNNSDKNEDCSRITSLGKTMAQLPLSPRFGKMLALSFSHNLLQYVTTLVAALSVQEVLLVNSHSSELDSKKEWSRLHRQWGGSGPRLLLGDPLVLLRAISAFEQHGGTLETCLKLGLRHKAMIEIRKLRKQLTSDVNLLLKSPAKEGVVDKDVGQPSEEECTKLRQILLAGFPDRVAKKVEGEVPSGEAKKYKNAYWCGELEGPVFLDSSSVLRSSSPQWVLYQEAHEINGKIYLRGLSSIDPAWILPLAPSLCNFGTPEDSPPPFYNEPTGTVNCWVRATYGKQAFPLPLSPIEHPHSAAKFKLLAMFFLQGDIFPKIKAWSQKLLSAPSIMTKAWARLQPRTQTILQALAAKGIERKSDLETIWETDEEFLLKEYLEWLPKNLHEEAKNIWPPIYN